MKTDILVHTVLSRRPDPQAVPPWHPSGSFSTLSLSPPTFLSPAVGLHRRMNGSLYSRENWWEEERENEEQGRKEEGGRWPSVGGGWLSVWLATRSTRFHSSSFLLYRFSLLFSAPPPPLLKCSGHKAMLVFMVFVCRGAMCVYVCVYVSLCVCVCEAVRNITEKKQHSLWIELERSGPGERGVKRRRRWWWWWW